MPLKYLNNKPAQYAIDGMQRGQWVRLIVSIFFTDLQYLCRPKN